MEVEYIIIGPRIYSDDAPLSVRWNMKEVKAGFNIWRLVNFLLVNKVVTKMQQEMDIFWQANQGPEDKILL